ncbi:MAG: pentapeptide repeat-containing protein [Actinomycetota bacterium]|nr:pentapeptide repeat-containing protein [Actinomycetota bacterium]
MTVDWQTCHADDCQGVRFGSGSWCWAHLPAEALTNALASLRPGGPLDARGTVLSGALIERLLARMCDAGSEAARVENADFTRARFLDDAAFSGVIFSGSTHFTYAVFERKASFFGAKFGGYVSFHEAKFGGLADFEGVSFGQAAFKQIKFTSAIFRDTTFEQRVEFADVEFDYVEFNGMTANSSADFSACQFNGSCSFHLAEFRGSAAFGECKFAYKAEFLRVKFAKSAHFVRDEFADDASFLLVKFQHDARFDESSFQAGAWFTSSEFAGECSFQDVKFEGDLLCLGARFYGNANFMDAEISGGMWLEWVEGHGYLNLDHLRAGGVLEVTGPFAVVKCVNAVVRGRAWFRLADSQLWLDNSEFSAPLTIESQSSMSFSGQEATTLSGAATHLRSLRGTDAEHLTLMEVDLSRCELSGLRRPEALSLVGRCQFASMPSKWCIRYGWLPWRWSVRDALFEEHIWRRSIGAPARGRGWEKPDPGQQLAVKPDRLAVMYRQLRSVLEDSRNEPGAADLYYGEMEMRRAASRAWGERWLLWMYWLVSGYGLRATRSLAALAGMILTAAIAFRYVGFPGLTADYWSCLVYAGGAVLSLDLASRHLPNVLTEWGDVLRIGLRVAGPVLLGLAALAVRGRIKR